MTNTIFFSLELYPEKKVSSLDNFFSFVISPIKPKYVKNNFS